LTQRVLVAPRAGLEGRQAVPAEADATASAPLTNLFCSEPPASLVYGTQQDDTYPAPLMGALRHGRQWQFQGRCCALISLGFLGLGGCHGRDTDSYTRFSSRNTAGAQVEYAPRENGRACSKEGWCWVYPVPHANGLFATWGSAGTDFWTGGDRGYL